MKIIEVVCDVKDCSAVGAVRQQERGDENACPACFSLDGDPEGVEAPEGWGIVIASDSSGELQRHLVCEVHNARIWALLGYPAES